MIRQTTQELTTAEQLVAMPDDGNRYELVNGVLKMMSPAGSEHGQIAERISRRLGNHVESNHLGATYAAETGFRIGTSPDTVGAPDAAYVSHSRLKSVEPTSGYLALAPDLVVEVVSPSDSSSDVEAKAEQWLNAGTLVVIVADPSNLSLRIYENATQISVLRSGETYSSGSACGNWELSVDDAFQIQNE
jgi:Uma2 family endonuclease